MPRGLGNRETTGEGRVQTSRTQMVASAPSVRTVKAMSRLPAHATLLADLRPEFRDHLVAGPEAFDNLRAWSVTEYSWRCPQHPGQTWTAAPNVLSRRPQTYLSRCVLCAQYQASFARHFPQLAQHALGWDPAVVKPKEVKARAHDWSCPRCGGTVIGTLTRLCGEKPLDDPTLLQTGCALCSGKTLATRPNLVAQFVRNGHDGTTNPAMVTTVSRDENRDRTTQWRCNICAEPFTMTVLTAVDLDNKAVTLHRPCRDRPGRVSEESEERRAERLEKFKAKQTKREQKILHVAHERIAAIREETSRREAEFEARRAEHAMSRQLSKAKPRWY